MKFENGDPIRTIDPFTFALVADGLRKMRPALDAGQQGSAIRELFSRPTRGAGVAISAPDGSLLFLRRANTGDHPGHWCFPGGGCEEGETHEDAALREVAEETGYIPDGDLRPIDRQRGDIDFVTFAHPVKKTFAPRLNHEHDGVAWAHPHNPPQPLHPGVAATIAKGILNPARAHDGALAFDFTGNQWRNIGRALALRFARF